MKLELGNIPVGGSEAASRSCWRRRCVGEAGRCRRKLVAVGEAASPEAAEGRKRRLEAAGEEDVSGDKKELQRERENLSSNHRANI